MPAHPHRRSRRLPSRTRRGERASSGRSPVWRLLAYSNEDPPTRRAMVVVDGITGEVVEWFAEDNPEDWSEL